ncbi:MAG: alpha/beta fold hydrolase [Planctomycetota bacterium]
MNRISIRRRRSIGLTVLTLILIVFVREPTFVTAQIPAASLSDTSKTEPGTNEILWYGELDAGTRLFRFLFKAPVEELGKGGATLISIDEGETEFVLKDVALDENGFSFSLPATKASYSGTLNTDGDSIEGVWSQRGAKLPLKLRKVASKPVDAAKEIWIGTINAGLQKLVIQFRIYADASGKLSALMDSVSQKAGGFKADVNVDGNNLSLNVGSLNAKFAGEKNATGTELVGKWTQGAEIPLAMKRVEAEADSKSLEPKRPQTPKGPFPYDSKEVTFKNPSAGVELSGTLTYPKLDKPVAVAILISGSGPQDRDETLLGHKPFAVLADYLSRNGIAVLRFDDRGVGKSTGNFNLASSKDFSSDVEAAIDFLKLDPRVDPLQIGLIGHSEGGLIAPGVAASRSDVAWIILMAGTGVNGKEILYSQGQLIVAANGGDDKSLRTQRTLQEVAFDQVESLEPGADTASVVEECAAKVLEKMTKEGDAPEGTDLEPFEKEMQVTVRGVLQTVNTPWMRYFLTYEPGPALEKTKCPALAINGEKDLQVDPKLNLTKIEQALKVSGNKDYTILTLPGLNHLFQTCSTGSPNEYESIEETLSPRFLETVGNWLKAHVK